MRKLVTTLSIAAAFGALLGSTAQAADWGFCRDYTRAAIRQVHAAYDSGRCMRRIDRYADRWSTNPDVHFRWCRNVSRDRAWDERNARRYILDRCRY